MCRSVLVPHDDLLTDHGKVLRHPHHAVSPLVEGGFEQPNVIDNLSPDVPAHSCDEDSGVDTRCL